MLTKSLWQKELPETNFDFLGEKIGDGADGELFELKEDSNQVIKISVLFDLQFRGLNYLNNAYQNTSKILSILEGDNNAFVKVFNHNKIGQFTRNYLNHNDNIAQHYLLYYYTMEKCFKISEDEKKVFHTILSHEDRGLTKNFSKKKIAEILFGLSMGLDFDSKKITLFYESLQTSCIKHLDMHPRNIMKDRSGNFKLVDLDRLQLENI
jgi:serine/threonine protein kinase